MCEVIAGCYLSLNTDLNHLHLSQSSVCYSSQQAWPKKLLMQEDLNEIFFSEVLRTDKTLLEFTI